MQSHSFCHPQEILLAQFSLCMYKGCLKPYLFHFVSHVSGGLIEVTELVDASLIFGGLIGFIGGLILLAVIYTFHKNNTL